MTFGAVMTFSTRVAGVLLVFVFLVAPAILAMLLTSRLRLQLLIGWITGTVVTVFGLFLSWRADLPSGPAVIAFYGVAIALGGGAVFFWRCENRFRAARTLAGGGVATLVLFFGIVGSGRWIGASSISVSEEARRVEASMSTEHSNAVTRMTRDLETRRAAIASRLAGCVGTRRISSYLDMAGPEERLVHARAKMAENRRRGLEFLLFALADEELPLLYRKEGLALLTEAEQAAFGYDPQADVGGNTAAIAAVCDQIGSQKRLRATTRDEDGDGG